MRNSKCYFIFIAALSIFSLLSCTSKSVQIPASQAAQQPKSEVKEGWQAEWERVQIEARKEGTLVGLISAGAELRRASVEAMKEYGIDMETISGRGDEVREKILRERKAGIYSFDIFSSGSSGMTALIPEGFFAPLEPLFILPEVKDPKLWYQGKLPFSDEGKTIFSVYAAVSGELHINTDMVKPGEISSLKDLLNPKWKGKIIMDDPTTRGRGNSTATVMTLRLGEDYIRQFVKQEPVLSRNRRQSVEWLAKGRYPIGIGLYQEQVREFKEVGAPVDGILFNDAAYLTGANGVFTHPTRAPHPNASRVFINWLLSKKGQTIWAKLGDVQSAREDVPTDFLPKGFSRIPGVDYLETMSVSYNLELKPKAEDIITRYFSPLLR